MRRTGYRLFCPNKTRGNRIAHGGRNRPRYYKSANLIAWDRSGSIRPNRPELTQGVSVGGPS